MDWDILGHRWAVDMLRSHLVGGNLRHAYLFSGPEGVGRRTLALRFAQALNCPKPERIGEPCRVCRTCLQIMRMAYPDLSIIQARERGAVISVEQIRELRQTLALTPYEGYYRVAILLNFEQANASAQNALLKTLEEPASRVILVITAESPESLFPTIVSRCEIMRLRPMIVEDLERELRLSRGFSEAQARLFAHISDGRPGYAMRLNTDQEMLTQRLDWLEDHARLLSDNKVKRFSYVETLLHGGTFTRQKQIALEVLPTWLSLWRDVMLVASGASVPLTNLDLSDEIRRLATRFGVQTACETVLALERTLALLDYNINPRLAVEVLMLDLPQE